jgi:hypothetical protein
MDSRTELVQGTLRGQPKPAYSTKNQLRKTLLFFVSLGARSAAGQPENYRWHAGATYLAMWGQDQQPTAPHWLHLPLALMHWKFCVQLPRDRCVKVEHAGTMRRRGPCLENTNRVQLCGAPSEHAAHNVNILGPCLLQATRPANASTDAVSSADTGS